MSVKFNVTIEAPDCAAVEAGLNGKKTHTAGPRVLFSQLLFGHYAPNGGSTRPISACPNHKHLYERNVQFRIIDAVELEKAPPVLKTVYVKSRQTGDLRTLVVKRAVSGQPVWYVQSDSGMEYLVQFRRGIWLCECKHFIARAFGRNEVCHHIDGVLEADPESRHIEAGADPKLRY